MKRARQAGGESLPERMPNQACGAVSKIPDFPTTHWSEVRNAGEPEHPGNARGWEWMAAHYWYPLYAYARRAGRDPEEAADLTQEFFAWLLEGNLLAVAAPERGRFRALLVTAFKNHLGMEARRRQSIKRGGRERIVPLDLALGEDRYRTEPANVASPDRLFERRWALDLIERALTTLEAEVNARGRPTLFARLKGSLLADRPETVHAETAAQLGMSESALKTAVYRMRQRFRSLVRMEIAATLLDPAELDDELRYIRTVLAGG
jgi:RNA polymerase sigma factor (sigma-70 family)